MVLVVAAFFAGRTSLRMEQERIARDNPPNLGVLVTANFEKTPLRRVVDSFGRQANIRVQLDERGLASERVSLDEPVSIYLSCPVSLASTFNLMLSPLRLSYYVKNGTIIITNEELAHRARQATSNRVTGPSRSCGVPW